MPAVQLTGGRKISELSENIFPQSTAEFVFAQSGNNFKINIEDLQNTISLVNIEDSGTNVISTASGTGYFQWDNIRLDGTGVSLVSGGTLSLSNTGGNVSLDAGASVLIDDLILSGDSIEGIGMLSGSSAGLNISSLSGDLTLSSGFDSSVSIEGLSYPKADGSNGQFLSTDGSGNLTFQDIPDQGATGNAGGDLTGTYPNPTIITSLRDNIPSDGEKAALAGTQGIPSDSNRYVTDDDSRLAGSTPTGNAGGDLTGTYPNPTIANDVVAIENLDPSLELLIPTADERAALLGTSGSPSLSNRYVTDEDPRVEATSSFSALSFDNRTSTPSTAQVETSGPTGTNISVVPVNRHVINNPYNTTTEILVTYYFSAGSTGGSGKQMAANLFLGFSAADFGSRFASWRKRLRRADSNAEDLYMIQGVTTIGALQTRSISVFLTSWDNNSWTYQSRGFSVIMQPI